MIRYLQPNIELTGNVCELIRLAAWVLEREISSLWKTNLANFCTNHQKDMDGDSYGPIGNERQFSTVQTDVEFYLVEDFESAAGWAAGSRKEGLRDAVKSYDFPRSVRPVTRSS
jgi:hypothetical protein